MRAHLDRNLDPGLHADLTRAGAYLGYDGLARNRMPGLDYLPVRFVPRVVLRLGADVTDDILVVNPAADTPRTAAQTRENTLIGSPGGKK